MPRSSLKSTTPEARPPTPTAWAKAHGLRFHNADLLTEALTHSSYANEADLPAAFNNERLEYLGDAVLGLISAELAFRLLPDATEGEMTRLRAALVRRDALAELARGIGLGDMLRLSVGEVRNGGRSRDKMLADSFEALMGALYLDRGIEAVRAFAEPKFDLMADQYLRHENQVDARSRFHYRVESEHGSVPTYRLVSETGPEHAREYTMEVLVRGVVWGVGVGHTKQIASQAAAAQALARLETPTDGS